MDYKKKERKMVAATIRKIHAPNQEAAVFDVSGSPEENLLYTLIPPIKPTTAPMAYINFVPGSKYDVTILVASVIPPIPLPCAKADDTAAKMKAADIRIFFFVIRFFD